MGAGFAQFANMFVNMIGSFLNAEEYQETMSQLTDGKKSALLIVCMGIIAPLAEEMIFRWLIYLRLRDYMRAVPAMVISGDILWNLSWKSGSGRLCEYSWNSVCVFYGTDRKLMGKCTASCGSKYLVTDPS